MIDQLIETVLETVRSPHTRRAYAGHLARFAESGAAMTKAGVQAYLNSLDAKASTHNQALSAIRRLAREAMDAGLIDTATLASIERIGMRKPHDRRSGTWLTTAQATKLIGAPSIRTLIGLRDRVLLGLLLECGLRREEAASVIVEQLEERDGRLCIIDLRGKGNKTRIVPVPLRLALHIQHWLDTAGITTGPVLRPVTHNETVTASTMSTTAVYKRVQIAAQEAKLDVSPHDLRRTFGRLTRQAGAELDQIRYTLGHSSVRTTEIYLGLHQDLADSPCDRIDLEKPADEPTHKH